MTTRVQIYQYSDGFGIVINERETYFSQEVSVEKLKELFESLGFEADYEEVF